MATTIQHLLSHSRLLNELIADFSATPAAAQKVIWAEIVQEGLILSAGLKDYAVAAGAGLYPNTFVKDGLYKYVNTPAEESAARAAGWVPATFPETMIKAGAPDRVVHNSVDKSQALDLGYTLPGLGGVIPSGA